MLKRTVAAAAIVLAVGLLTTACDDRPCVSGHYITTTTIVPSGKTFVPITTQTWVCDVYGPEPVQ